MKNKNEKGIVSIFVLFAMMLLLIFVFSIYSLVDNKLKENEKQNLNLLKIYSNKLDLIDSNKSADNSEIIPIYNINQLNIVGTGSFIKIDSQVYQCGMGMSYVLKDNIIVDIAEDLFTNRINFNDYKLYSQIYYIDKYIYDIYYYKDNTYWKNIYYKNFTEKDNSDLEYSENQFSIIDKYENNNTEFEYMMIWKYDGIYNLAKSIQSEKANNLDEIIVYKENINKINVNGEIYIFINIGNKI